MTNAFVHRETFPNCFSLKHTNVCTYAIYTHSARCNSSKLLCTKTLKLEIRMSKIENHTLNTGKRKHSHFIFGMYQIKLATIAEHRGR